MVTISTTGTITNLAIYKLIQMWWYARTRRLDLKYLWPSLCVAAPDLLSAKIAFARYATKEPAWRALGEDEFIAFMDKLEAPNGNRTKRSQRLRKANYKDEGDAMP